MIKRSKETLAAVVAVATRNFREITDSHARWSTLESLHSSVFTLPGLRVSRHFDRFVIYVRSEFWRGAETGDKLFLLVVKLTDYKFKLPAEKQSKATHIIIYYTRLLRTYVNRSDIFDYISYVWLYLIILLIFYEKQKIIYWYINYVVRLSFANFSIQFHDPAFKIILKFGKHCRSR